MASDEGMPSNEERLAYMRKLLPNPWITQKPESIVFPPRKKEMKNDIK